MTHKNRIQLLNQHPVKKNSYVVYWMQQSQRAVCNHALEYAISTANALNQKLIVFFCLTPHFPEANLRHYTFMIQGLLETKEALKERGILMLIDTGDMVEHVVNCCKSASILVTDRGYLRIQRGWRSSVAEKIACSMIEVDSDCIVPVTVASPKEEFSAGTFRPKILRLLNEYMVMPVQEKIQNDSLSLRTTTSIKKYTLDSLLDIIKPDVSVQPVVWISGGTSAALERLSTFIHSKLDHFAEYRNDPSLNYYSSMSPYLHFGQISALQIALEIKLSKSPGKAAFLEELIVRRELAFNFVWYNQNYDSFKCLPGWAVKTLSDHCGDKRDYNYTRKQLELGRTHDPYWNAAQLEMVVKGKMHGYMRMYWGKKILEWMTTPQDAFSTALYLNNKYEIDGRDPSGFAGVAWCFGKHDRAWGERQVFGKVRYMNAAGLKRKFDIEQYVKTCYSLP